MGMVRRDKKQQQQQRNKSLANAVGTYEHISKCLHFCNSCNISTPELISIFIFQSTLFTARLPIGTVVGQFVGVARLNWASCRHSEAFLFRLPFDIFTLQIRSLTR